MKIIAIENESVHLLPDSAILKDGKPFFVPDNDNLTMRPAIIFHICRLGKNIAAKFAHRYYDSAAPAISIIDKSRTDALARAFDGAAILGDFHPCCNTTPEIEILFNDTSTGILSPSDINFDINDTIENLSKLMTLKIGDYILCIFSNINQNVTRNMSIKGLINTQQALSMKTK